MANEHINKVVLGDEVLLDLTSDTATAADVAAGKTLHLATGARAVGNASYAGSPTVGGNANASNAILYGAVDSTSTSTAFTATVDGLDALVDGTTVMLRNAVVTSAAGFTININDLGAKPVYNSLATGNPITPTNPTQDSTIFNINYTMMFTYVEDDVVAGGCWLCFRGYDSNTNTIGYQIRTNSGNMVASDTGYRYRIWLTQADGKKWVPINTSTSTNATSNRTLNTRKIDPFGRIVYRATNGTCSSGSGIGATGIWDVYTLSIGYSYMASGFSLTAQQPVYLRCAPQTDGSAQMEVITQTLPSSNDGKIYIHLGTAYSTTSMELELHHPVYWHDGTGLRLWSGAASSGGPSPSSTSPAMDGTAAVGTSTDYARADHVHPTDTSRAAATHDHGNITSGGDITATAPTVASGDKIIINDESASKVTNGPAFGTSTTTFLRNDGTWAAPAGGNVAWGDVTGKPFTSVTGSANVAPMSYLITSGGYCYYEGMNVTQPLSDLSFLEAGQTLSVSLGTATNVEMTCAEANMSIGYGGTCARLTGTGTIYELKFIDMGDDSYRCTARTTSRVDSDSDITGTITLVPYDVIDTSALPTATASTPGIVALEFTTASLGTAGWSSNTRTINVAGVTTSNNVIVVPAPSSAASYAAAGIVCTAQGAGTLTFTRTSANSSALKINVLILG